jgi:hypothetical protein
MAKKQNKKKKKVFKKNGGGKKTEITKDDLKIINKDKKMVEYLIYL